MRKTIFVLSFLDFFSATDVKNMTDTLSKGLAVFFIGH